MTLLDNKGTSVKPKRLILLYTEFIYLMNLFIFCPELCKDEKDISF